MSSPAGARSPGKLTHAEDSRLATMDTIAILMLEDSQLDADLAVAILKRGGMSFAYDRVDSRQGFEDALAARRYDLILADYSLPSFIGSEALSIAQEKAPGTPFIFVSGALGEELAIEMLQRGATDYVLKQRLDRLAPAMLRALNEAREKRRAAQAEKAHRESEERYRTLVECVPQLIWTCGPDGECDFLNARWVEYTGIPEREQLGKHWLDAVHPGDRQMAMDCWMKAVRSEGDYDVEYRLRGAKGQYRWFKARGVRLRDENGKTVKWFGSSTDIHDQKSAEDALRAKSEALARSNADLQQFAYVASHDLQEPLRSVISYTQLLQKRYRGRLDEDADEFISYAVDGASRMQKLIQDLLDYSRATAEGEQDFAPVSAAKALRSALTNLSAAVSESGTVVTHDTLPLVRANESQLVHVFQNLIANAMKYRREDPPQVHVSARRDGANWVISVQDNGQGFENEQAERIFGIFQRLHGRDVPGTGMGLAICKRIIEAHGGAIWAKAEPGRGATFSFTLPPATAL